MRVLLCSDPGCVIPLCSLLAVDHAEQSLVHLLQFSWTLFDFYLLQIPQPGSIFLSDLRKCDVLVPSSNWLRCHVY